MSVNGVRTILQGQPVTRMITKQGVLVLALTSAGMIQVVKMQIPRLIDEVLVVGFWIASFVQRGVHVTVADIDSVECWRHRHMGGILRVRCGPRVEGVKTTKAE